MAGAALVGLAALAAMASAEMSSGAPGQLCAAPGRDGAASTLGGVVNTYLPGTADVAAGALAIPVGPQVGAAQTIADGDLLLVIQMQGADLDSSDSDSYGDGTAGAPASGALPGTISAGRFEYVVATGPVASGSLPIAGKGTGGGLLNDYVQADATATAGARRFQVVRVPQHASATAAASLTARAWDGSTGGILALDVVGPLTLSGAVDVSGLGFRGGGNRQLGGAGGLPPGTFRSSASSTTNAPKGEGIAGTPRWVQVGGTVTDTGVEGLPNGSQGRGAPGTGGGGGTDGNEPANDQNTGGGGGGNGGAGGQGGNAWFSALPYGGDGGAAFSASATALVLGGGGGAGTRNNAGPSGGAAGGGMILVRAGSVAGAGSFLANGGDGSAAANDGGGGGGAGGSILVDIASGGLGALTVTADGGEGGLAWPTQPPGGSPGARHGPGGGGGGGVVLTSATPAAASVAPGSNGTTTTAADPYGATPGMIGVTTALAAGVPGADAGARCVPIVTVTKSTSTATVVNGPSGTTASYTIRIANEIARAAATGVSVVDTLPTGFSYASTSSITLSGGATRSSVSDPLAGSTAPTWGAFSIPGGGAVQITFVASVASTVPAGTVQNGATATFDDLATPGSTTTSAYDPSSSTAEDVSVTLPSPPTPTPTPTPKPKPPQPPPTPAPVADLRVRVTGPPTGAPGDVAALLIEGGNDGPDASPGTTVVVTLPAGVTMVSSVVEIDGRPTAVPCSLDGVVLRCTVGLLQVRSGIVLRLGVRLGQATNGQWITQAAIAGGATDPITTNNAASHAITLRSPGPTPKPKPSVPGKRPALVLTKRALKPTARPGASVAFKLTLRNRGTAAASGIVVCDQPPRRTTLVSAPGAMLSRGRACWRIASLLPGRAVGLRLTLRVDSAAPAGRMRNVAILVGRDARVAAEFVVRGKPLPGDGGGVTG